MKQSPEHSNSSFDRRKFIGNSIKLALLAGIVSPLEQACKNKSSQQKKTNGDSTDTKNKKNTHTAKHPGRRRKWNQEKLILNSKTNVIHLPTAVVYNYYDQITHVKEVNINNWESAVQGQIRLNRELSGNILEALSLQELRAGVNDDTLNLAIRVLSKAFGKDGENSKGVNLNSRNYRLHELMLQLVALNNSIPATNKWQTFNEKVKKPQKLGKREKWMETENSFNERIKYIQDRVDDYKTRLGKRASKYSLT